MAERKEQDVRRAWMTGPRALLGLGGLLGLVVASQGCIVSFDASESNAFSCQTDADCLSPLICIFAQENAEAGVCSRRGDENSVVIECTDNDEDGYGEGDCEPDCDDDDDTVYPGAEEICDGKDNDCDCMEDRAACPLEMIDEIVTCTNDDDCPSDQPAASNGMMCVNGECQFKCELTLGVCAGKTTTCTTARDDANGTVTGTVVACAISGAYGAQYAATTEEREACDGVDNNCNGMIDGSAMCMQCDPENPSACSSDLGICSRGVRLCEDNMPGACVDPDTMQPVQEPEAEVCDGLDNNCDGVIDNAMNNANPSTVCPERCPFGMTLIRDTTRNMNFCVDQYEASRPDATASSAGADAARAVSQPGVLPWTGLDIQAAQEACRGTQDPNAMHPRKRLCQIQEVQFACGGANMDPYPYGVDYNATTCNGTEAGFGVVAPTGPTADGADTDFAMCFARRPDVEIYDLVGNVSEFVVQNNQPRLHGGSFLSTGADLTCTSNAEGAGMSGPSIGFRCCFDP